MPEDTPDERKIIIDEDWKTQVQSEREQLIEPKEGSDGETTENLQADDQIPPASLTFLISTMASQVMASLGQFPDPIEGKPVVHLDFARHYIDMLGVLQEKTTGNRSEEESSLLEDAVHQLRMLYVEVKTRFKNKRGVIVS